MHADHMLSTHNLDAYVPGVSASLVHMQATWALPATPGMDAKLAWPIKDVQKGHQLSQAEHVVSELQHIFWQQQQHHHCTTCATECHGAAA
jgi:hypothetical protein